MITTNNHLKQLPMGKVKQSTRQKFIDNIMSSKFRDDEDYQDDTLTFLESLTLDELELLSNECDSYEDDEDTNVQVPEFIKGIDFKLLREQKAVLLSIMEWNKIPQVNDSIDGIVHLLDALQDYCTDELGFDELEVFGDLNDEGE